MDPNTTLTEMRELAAAISKEYDRVMPDFRKISDLAADLAMRVDGLDTWLTKGGFPPSDWNHNPKPSERDLIGPLG